MSFQNSKTDSEVCVVCCKPIDIYAFGVCDHPVCYECSTRMRVLCRQNECPICRQDLPEVVFSRKLQKFENVHQRNSFIDQKYQIYFQNSDVFRAYEKLLEHPCTICRNRTFPNFILLKDHVRKEHEQFYCDLCVENLKIFSSERKSYSRSELARHRRIGDPDNTSHRGHPLCEFCDQRHLDKDELFRHLRREHFFCHFCDADGLYEFYSDYDYLRQHFRHKHFLCEEGSCKDEKFTSVFRTDIDLKVHKATVHNKNLSKAQAKQARTLELEFTITPRVQQSNYGRSSGVKMDMNSRKSNHSVNQKRGLRQVEMEEGAVGGVPENDVSMFSKSAIPYVDSSKDFPTLDGKDTPQNQKMKSQSDSFAQRLAKSNRFTVKVSDDNLGSEEFPSLSGSTVETTVQSQWKVNGANKIAASSLASAPSAGPSKQSKSVYMQLKNSDFPSLPTNNKTKSSKVSIQVNNAVHSSAYEEPRKSNVSLISDNALANSLGSNNSKEIVKTSQTIKLTEQDFPQLTEGSKPPEPSWITVKTSSKVKPKSAINETSVGNKTNNLSCDRKSSSVTIPVQNNKINLQGVAESLLPSVSSNKNKSKKKKTKNTTSEASDVSNSNKVINCANEPNKKKKKEPSTTYTNHIMINERIENQENENPQLEDPVTLKSADLQIDTYCKDINISELADDLSQQTSFLAVEDFPELPSKPNNTVQPLNSSQQSNNKPPPGFNLCVKSLSKPPPGFRVSINSVSQASNLDGLSSFPNNKGETPFSSREVHKYHEPDNFHQRNTELINKIKEIVENDESHFSAFKILSGQFRQGAISASNYYQQCLNLIGRKEFAEIFPELLVLLPDIGKQRELLNVHNNLLKERELCGNIDLANENGTQFLVCATCQQVLARDDFRKHMDVHEVNGNFPLLSSSVVANNTSWVKK